MGKVERSEENRYSTIITEKKETSIQKTNT
jgi:hypothetical protein